MLNWLTRLTIAGLALGLLFAPAAQASSGAFHAWIWRHNPLGTFANYNPRVKLCPGH